MSQNPAPLDSRSAGVRNENLVLGVLASHGQLSQTQLCRLTGLSSSTASYIVGRLREKNLIIEQPGTSERRGAKPVLLSINPQARHIVGVEISPSYVLLGLFDFTGEVVETLHFDTPADHDPTIIGERIEIHLRGLIGKHHVEEDDLLGIGVTLSGSLTDDGAVVLSSPLAWKDVPLRTMLQERFRAEVSVHTTRVRLLAETSTAQPQLPANTLYLNVGNGVGGHFTVDGVLAQGATRRSGELGHIVVDPEGPQCGCGRCGCLETFISGPALAQRIRRDLAAGARSALAAAVRADHLPEQVIAAWGEALRAGDGYALGVRDFLVEHLAWMAGIAVNILDPRRLILGGYVIAQCPEEIIEMIRGRLASDVYDAAARKIDIQPARAGELALVRGVAVAIRQTALEIA